MVEVFWRSKESRLLPISKMTAKYKPADEYAICDQLPPRLRYLLANSRLCFSAISVNWLLRIGNTEDQVSQYLQELNNDPDY